MIHLNNTIKIAISESHFRTKYKATCDKCGIDRGYLSKSNAIKPFCRKCSPRVTPESRKKMSLAKLGKKPWNKGRLECRNSVKKKLSLAKLGKEPHNKNKQMSYEQKIKLSCAARKINLSEFDELQTPKAKIERNKFAEMEMHIKCFEKHNYTCDCCGVDKVLLNAHHKNSWKFFSEQRFDINNLVALCKSCHDDFHKIYGNGKSSPNTEEQYFEFKNNFNKSKLTSRKKVIVVAGASGAGKSWVCNQIKHKFYYCEHDKTNKDYIRSFMFNLKQSIVVYDPTVHVSSFIKRNSDLFDINLIVIQEDEATIKLRLEERGGEFTPSIKRRILRMKNLAKGAVFTGTSSEVLEFILRTY
jgi:hypothetical protein